VKEESEGRGRRAHRDGPSFGGGRGGPASVGADAAIESANLIGGAGGSRLHESATHA